MLLIQENFQKIADYFKNKFSCIVYVGCWDNKSITFGIYQDSDQTAGFELTIKKPSGDMIEMVEVLKVRRLQTYGYNAKKQRYEKRFLPIYISR